MPDQRKSLAEKVPNINHLDSKSMKGIYIHCLKQSFQAHHELADLVYTFPINLVGRSPTLSQFDTHIPMYRSHRLCGRQNFGLHIFYSVVTPVNMLPYLAKRTSQM